MSIYHLHIPRTSGVFIRENFVKNEDNSFYGHTSVVPNDFSDFKYVSGHFATTPINKNGINFSMIRNPIDLACSYITYMRNNFYPTKSFDQMLEFYIENNKIENFSNINIKFLTGKLNIKSYNENIKNIKNVAENGWFIENFSTDVDDALNVINNNKTILIDFYDNDRHNKICSIYNKYPDNNKINQSNKKDKDFIKSYEILKNFNSLDLELYYKIVCDKMFL